MAISVKSQYSIQQLCLISTAGITCLIGLIIHLFIVGVSIIDRLKGRPLTTADLLITSIGTSRIIFHFVSLFVLSWETFADDYSTVHKIAFNIFGGSSTYCNIWLSVLLSIFYSLKIRNFHNSFFLYLKKIISQRVLGLIVVFVMLSVGFSLVGVLETFVNISKNGTLNDKIYIAKMIKLEIFLYSLWNVLPCLFYVISSFTLLGSLYHHMIRMKRDKNATSHLEAYLKMIKFTVASFLCFALYMSVSISGIVYFEVLGFPGLCLAWNCFPMLHSIYLIYMTARLRNHYFTLLNGMTKCLFLCRGSESRSGARIQIINQ